MAAIHRALITRHDGREEGSIINGVGGGVHHQCSIHTQGTSLNMAAIHRALITRHDGRKEGSIINGGEGSIINGGSIINVV